MFLTKIVERVDVAAVSLNADVAVDTAGDAAAARFGDLLALVDRLSRGNEQRRVVLVIRDIAVVVVDDNDVAHRALVARVGHAAAVGGVDWRAVGAGDVDALVVARRAADTRTAVAEGQEDCP